MSTEIVPSQQGDAPAVCPVAPRPGVAPPASSADRFMRKLLRLPEGTTSTAAEARSAFQKSIFISAARCVLMYIFFPFVLPLIGVAKGVGPVIGLVIGLLAIVSIVFSIRRFWRANHSKRWHYTIFGLVIIGFLIALAIKDFGSIAS
ncbi:MAG: hypothetical protein ABWZ99_07800 [Ilumatobacteraceae bacterium]